jgi:hypothetical protein
MVTLPMTRSGEEGESLTAFPTNDDEERAIVEEAILVFYWQLS